MTSFVHKTLVVELQAGVTDRFAVLAHLSYDPSDPFAVTLVFSHDGRVLARWQLDREMLTAGLTRPVGIGDVRLCPEARGVGRELRMEFLGEAHADGGRHHAVVFAWAEAVGDFLRETRRSVPPGREEVRVDDFLAAILAGS
ncbi:MULTISPECIES: SsgA family sporulation/cell division regulator [unclassified Streptomyces]|uniref:SsgA family sporulation/cell division regulator n=1 Tax=unclassified Streptomyces TaxID=2593676 RepID=UPI000F6B3B10|nr:MULTISPECIES: SsgA family sporulation/cell division regulator [unclassified Streptomyces]AZM63869.1 SsgA family sporulation/cell division regulator [Streptomyces sp. WAC 01438]RSM94932.1 SsgA family sporulation/cell division regulator [Streptomyces sp. WAC 01420]